MKYQGFTNISVPVELINKLSQHPEFQGGDNYKRIAPCFELLTRIHRITVIEKTEWVSYNSDSIQNIFKCHNLTSYLPFIQILVSEGFMQIDAKGFPMNFIAAKCNKYRITDESKSMLQKNLVNLRNHFNDPIVKKAMNTNKRKQNSRFNKKETNPVLLHHQEIFSKLQCDGGMLSEIVKNLDDGAKANIDYSIINLERGDYNNCISEKDGRLHHTFLLMKSDARKAFYIKSENNKFLYRYFYTIDIRACHPTLFSLLFSSIPSILQYTVDSVTPTNRIILESELKRWVLLWTDVENDPRYTIATEMGLPMDTEENKENSKTKVKHLLNTALNDKRWDNKLKQWMKAQFPCMYNVWLDSMDVSQTGCTISKNFETKVMLNPKLYEFAKTLTNVKVIAEHDGMGVLCKEGVDVTNELESLRNYIIQLFNEEFGMKPVVKVELA